MTQPTDTTIQDTPLDTLCKQAAVTKGVIKSWEAQLELLEAEIRRRTLAKEDSLMTQWLRTSIVAASMRVTWNSDMLEGMAVAVPEILRARTQKPTKATLQIFYTGGE